MKFETLEINGEDVRISVFEKGLRLSFDIWSTEWGFGDEILNQLKQLWVDGNNSPEGDPVTSRSEIQWGADPNTGNVLFFDFLCEENKNIVLMKFLDLIKDEKNFKNYKVLREQAEKAEQEIIQAARAEVIPSNEALEEAKEIIEKS